MRENEERKSNADEEGWERREKEIWDGRERENSCGGWERVNVKVMRENEEWKIINMDARENNEKREKTHRERDERENNYGNNERKNKNENIWEVTEGKITMWDGREKL